jgi:hypothetical protein
MMLEELRTRPSKVLGLIIVFAALTAITDSFVGIPQFSEGVWYSWIFIIVALNGIVLGPFAGCLSTFIGATIGHFIFFRGTSEFLFTLGAPIGAMFSGFLFQGKWKLVVVFYTLLLAIYFLTPEAWTLPLWGMWDTYLAYATLLLFSLLQATGKIHSHNRMYLFPLATFIGLEGDILFRIFLFIPLQTYRIIYGLNMEALQLIWGVAAVITPIQVGIAAVATLILGIPVLNVLKRTRFGDPD